MVQVNEYGTEGAFSEKTIVPMRESICNFPLYAISQLSKGRKIICGNRGRLWMILKNETPEERFNILPAFMCVMPYLFPCFTVYSLPVLLRVRVTAISPILAALPIFSSTV